MHEVCTKTAGSEVKLAVLRHRCLFHVFHTANLTKRSPTEFLVLRTAFESFALK